MPKVVTARDARVEPARMALDHHPSSGRRRPKLSDAFRETSLLLIDDPADREALRRVGRLIHDMAVVETDLPGPDSPTHNELRAAAAELRFMEFFLKAVCHSAQESVLPPEDVVLAQFAGRMALQVGALAETIEERIGAAGHSTAAEADSED
jgi:hypothetical protein